MKLHKKLQEEVLKIYETWLYSYLNGDVETYNYYLHDDYRFIGSTDNEDFLDKNDTTRFFEETADQLSGKAEARNSIISTEQFGELIFITDLFDAYFLNNDAWAYYGKFRFSSALKKTKNGWRFVYQHFSTPDSKAQEGETLGIEKVSKENLELREAIQRRTIELEHKNKELEIETALEKVRSVASSMQKPNDLLSICETLFNELKKLGFNELRNSLINILYDDGGYVLNYDFSDHLDGTVTKLMYDSHPVVENFLRQIRRTKDAFAEIHLSGKELTDWKLQRKSQGEPYDKRLEETDSLYYYFYSVDSGGIGISTFSSIDENRLLVLKRFRNVFDFAYRRYRDITLAQKQAREAQVEAALERIRSRSMAMQKSEELADLSLELVKQVQSLDVETWFCAFNIYDEDGKGSLEWGSNGEGTFSKYRTPREGIFKRYYEVGQSGETLLINKIDKKESAAHYEYLCSLPGLGDQLLKMKKEGYSFPTSQIDHIAFFKYGYIIFVTYEAAPEAHDIFKRFAKVFEQTYTRFLDLQKAEEQAKEAQIELSLERIRAKVSAMSESSDLLDIVVTMRSEFVSLGYEAHYFWYMRWHEDTYEKAMTSGDGSKIGMIMTLPRHIHGDIKLVSDWEKSDEPTVVLAMDVEMAMDYVQKMITLGEFKLVDPNAPTADDMRHIGGLTFVMARTNHGEIGFSLPGVVSNPPKESLDTLVRFAGVFDLAYARFKDLSQARIDLEQLKAEKKRAEEALAELKSTQSQLIQSEKMASLGELTAGIAHEIQNPLNFVNNFSEVSNELIDEMNEELDGGDIDEAKLISKDIKENLEKINHHGKRAEAIVKGMLQHSRSSSGTKEPTNINVIADEYLRLAFHGLRAKDKSFNATLKTDFDESLGLVEVIPQEIGRVILNLITNAFYVVDEKKKSGIENYEPTVTVKTKKTKSKVEIIVMDNGNGIPKHILDKIFQPFFTTKPTGQGTGLGLSMSYDIITKGHGGELIVNTNDGVGTEFVIRLNN